MQKIFEHQTAIISGGLGDIGRATALALAERGASIALCDIRPVTAAGDLLKELNQYSIQNTYHQVDVTDAKAVREWLTEIETTSVVPTIIIANAATVTLAGIHEITPAQWDKELGINLNGAFYLTQHATSRLVTKKISGRVVFVGSWAGSSVHKHIPAYSVSKAGLRMLCKCMALELAPYDILVNEIAPGYVAAGLTGTIWNENPGSRERALEKVPLKRVINTKEVANQIIYLCHPDNRHMTGSTLLMDGGLSLL